MSVDLGLVSAGPDIASDIVMSVVLSVDLGVQGLFWLWPPEAAVGKYAPCS